LLAIGIVLKPGCCSRRSPDRRPIRGAGTGGRRASLLCRAGGDFNEDHRSGAGVKLMVQTIEEFVKTLQEEGVEAGRRQAEKLLAEAKQQAERIIEQAKQQAAQIVDEAHREAQRVRVRSETELRLAARDTITRLQDALKSALRAVLFPAVRRTLMDEKFLADLIRDVVLRYAENDAIDRGAAVARVSKEIDEKQRQQMASQMLESLAQGGGGLASINLEAVLAEAGFELVLRDGTVEVTTEAVVDSLTEMVGPEVRKLISEAAGS